MDARCVSVEQLAWEWICVDRVEIVSMCRGCLSTESVLESMCKVLPGVSSVRSIMWCCVSLGAALHAMAARFWAVYDLVSSTFRSIHKNIIGTKQHQHTQQKIIRTIHIKSAHILSLSLALTRSIHTARCIMLYSLALCLCSH